MSAGIEGRVARVTGGGRGIGKGICLALAEAGADIAVVYRRDEEAARIGMFLNLSILRSSLQISEPYIPGNLLSRIIISGEALAVWGGLLPRYFTLANC